MSKHLILSLIGCLYLSILGAQNTLPEPIRATPEPIRATLTQLTQQVQRVPQEKIHLHMDKPYYSAGERIWFRAHMVHASLHLPIHLSRYIYVELIDADENVVLRKKIRPEEGMYYGQMDLSPDLPEGWYNIRSYTLYLQNFGPSWFYRKNVYIGNRLKPSPDKTTQNKQKQDQPDQPFLVTFTPEGGHLVSGNIQRIAYRGVNEKGQPTPIMGIVKDETGVEVCSFGNESETFGVFALLPQKDKIYTAFCSDAFGNKRSMVLNLPESTVPALAIQQSTQLLMVSLLTFENSPLEDTLYLIAHQRGIPLLQGQLSPSQTFMRIPKKDIAPGTVSFLLLNKSSELLSERTVFVDNGKEPKLTLTWNKTTFGKRDLAYANIQLVNSLGQGIPGNFSISITDDELVKQSSANNGIRNQLLLASDLDATSPFLNITQNIDPLMMTYKWSRFDITDIIQGKLRDANKYPLEIGTAVSGYVRTYPTKRGMPDMKVSMIVNNPPHFDAINTDETGRFYFDGFEIPDSTTIWLQTEKKFASFANLIPDIDSFPEVTPAPVLPMDQNPALFLDDYLSNSREKYFYENGMMHINLDNVVVTAKKEDKHKTVREDRGAFYTFANYTVDAETLETAATLVDALMMAPGITLDDTGTGVLLRGKRPLIMIDNMEYEMQDMAVINPMEVEMIDILRDPNETALFGSQGGNGVINIFLKRGGSAFGSDPGPHHAKITPLGYSKSQPFPMPDYANPSLKRSTVPDLRSTIYWKPDVTTDSLGKSSIQFYTADAARTYTVHIEGVTPQGEIIEHTETIIRK